VRAAIDLRLFVGLWYRVSGCGARRVPTIERNPALIDQPDPVVLAFDIETTKSPLKFPDSAVDEIMMISYMIDGQVRGAARGKVIPPSPTSSALFPVKNL
jgi:DNA polymerase epsilon subunit 1